MKRSIWDEMMIFMCFLNATLAFCNDKDFGYIAG
jgi:hypothetical protein